MIKLRDGDLHTLYVKKYGTKGFVRESQVIQNNKSGIKYRESVRVGDGEEVCIVGFYSAENNSLELDNKAMGIYSHIPMNYPMELMDVVVVTGKEVYNTLNKK